MLRRLQLFYKAGVTKRGDFADFALKEEAAHRGWWPFSYQILESLCHDFADSDTDLLNRLYTSLEAGAGVFKITRPGRFDQLDSRICEWAREAIPGKSLLVHDAAASNAITSVELYRRLSEIRSCRLTASDYFHRLWLVKTGQWTVAFDEQHSPLQLSGPGFVLPVRRKESWRYCVNRIVQQYLLQRVVPAAQERLARFRSQDCPEPMRSSDIRALPLFHPLAIRTANTEQGFELCQHDVFRPLEPKVDILRVMNFLTPRHLPDLEILRGFRAMVESVVPGGLIVVGRTRDELDDALLVSAYEVDQEGGFRKVWQADGPWEAEELVVERSAKTDAGLWHLSGEHAWCG